MAESRGGPRSQDPGRASQDVRVSQDQAQRGSQDPRASLDRHSIRDILPSAMGGQQRDESGNNQPRSGGTRTRLRSASIRFLESNPPSGMWHATGTALAAAPTPLEIRRGDFGHQGWDGPQQRRTSDATMSSLSRVSSAMTPASLQRSRTNPLEMHEEDEAAETQTQPAARGQQLKKGSATQQVAGVKDDSIEREDNVESFIGRGRITSQSYEPKPAAKIVEGEVSSESDSLDDLDPRPKRRIPAALPNKFMDPKGDSVPVPDGTTATDAAGAVKFTDDTKTGPPPPVDGPDEFGVYPNGYKFPPKHTWGESTLIGLKAFWKFTCTPLGFLIVIYGLNVVAWGGMLFLLLIGGGKALCHPAGSPPGYKDCNDLYAPRRIWIEIDSQILNGLFCVTGFGLIPWRFRDLYYILQYRIRGNTAALRRLGGIHRAWFRLPGSHDLPADVGGGKTSKTLGEGPSDDNATNDDITANNNNNNNALNLTRTATVVYPAPEENSAYALPLKKTPDAPLTGYRAPDTAVWKLDFVIWMFVLNTFLQAVLSGFMWGLNRFNRPSWSTGTFIALACIVAGLGGLMSFQEGKRIKKVEGIPVPEEEMLEDVERSVMEHEKRRHGSGQDSGRTEKDGAGAADGEKKHHLHVPHLKHGHNNKAAATDGTVDAEEKEVKDEKANVEVHETSTDEKSN